MLTNQHQGPFRYRPHDQLPQFKAQFSQSHATGKLFQANFLFCQNQCGMSHLILIEQGRQGLNQHPPAVVHDQPAHYPL